MQHRAVVWKARFQFVLAGIAPLFFGTALLAAPELSTGPGQPIEFDQKRGALVATGDAAFRDGPLLVQAEEIGFYREEQRAEARGRVGLTRSGFKLLAPSVNYRIEERSFTATDFKAGRWPLYFEGTSLSAEKDRITFQDATVYFGEPRPLSPRIEAQTLTYFENGDLKANRARIRLGEFPVLPLPRFSGSLERSPVRYTGRIGFRDNLGFYLQNEALLQVTPETYAGLNLDLYTERGFLFGPALLYRSPVAEKARLDGSLLTGWIQDGGELGNDRLGRPVDEDRSFIEWSHAQALSNGLQINGRLSWWSDAEVTRDFRPDLFYSNQNPDSFLEALYQNGPIVGSVLTRFAPNDFQVIRTRLPELRLDLLPTALGKTGLWQRGSLSFVRLKEELPDPLGNYSITPGIPQPNESDRADLQYGWIYPLKFAEGIQLTPRVAGKITHYFDTLDPADDGDYTRVLGEIGLDLDIRATGSWNFSNEIWGIDGLRHVFRPRFQYRYVPDASAGSSRIYPIDRPVLSFNRGVVNLIDDRIYDVLGDRHFLRLGVENVVFTRHREHGVRELASINIFQDVLLDKPSTANTWNSFWTEVELSPAPWIDFILFTRSDFEDQTLSELRGRIRIQDADHWWLSFGSDYLDETYDQYLIEYSRRLHPNWRADFRLRWDARLEEWIEQEFGLSQRVGQSFLLRYALRLREGSSREDDLQISLSLNFLGF